MSNNCSILIKFGGDMPTIDWDTSCISVEAAKALPRLAFVQKALVRGVMRIVVNMHDFFFTNMEYHL